MTLTKKDYMRLPKERLAEMLVERDDEERIQRSMRQNPIELYPSIRPYYPWWDTKIEITCDK